MTIFSSAYKHLKLKTLNHIRKFLKAYSLANIAMINGKYISHLAYTVEESNNLRREKWPRTPKMMPSMITLWQSALKICFLKPYSNDRKL